MNVYYHYYSVRFSQDAAGFEATAPLPLAPPVQCPTDTGLLCSSLQGHLVLRDCRAVMQYSLPRDGRPGEPPKVLHDWICSKVREGSQQTETHLAGLPVNVCHPVINL